MVAPDPQELALERAMQHINAALSELSFWTPHGGDSQRVGDYHASKEARRHLNRALTELEVAVLEEDLWRELAEGKE